MTFYDKNVFKISNIITMFIKKKVKHLIRNFPSGHIQDI